MSEYKIVSILWEDHTTFTRTELPGKNDLEHYIRPSLTIGLLYKKTKRYYVIAYNIERYDHIDEADFIFIFRDSILAVKEYGTIKLNKLRHREG